MTQKERRIFLIKELLKEDNGSAGKFLGLPYENDDSFSIPDDEKNQQALLRSLMNVRAPHAVSETFLKVQDDYLRERNRERGCTDLTDLKPFSKNDTRLYLWQGDITTLKVDAIVNAANSELLGCFAPLHTCIDNCIHTFAGIQLRLACHELMQKQGKPEETGLCKITPAFNLPSKYVLHTVGPIISASVRPVDKVLLANCYKSCLLAALEKGLESVAFCCISTGVFRFPQEMAARIAVDTVRAFLTENKNCSIKKVVFNVFGDKDLEIYKACLK